MENKESWIRKTLESLDNMQTADVSPQLAERLYKTTSAKDNIRSIRPIDKWAIAASIILLAGVNIFSVLYCSKSTTTEKQEATNPVYKEYFSYLNEYQ